MEKEFVANVDAKNMRLDKFLTGKLDITRSYIKTLIAGCDICVNDKVVKAGYELKEGDKILVRLPEPRITHILPEKIDIDIVYEDDDIVVINKAQGMIVHPTSSVKSGTLVNALLYHIKNLSGINGKLRPGIVHRIDKDTSGLLVVAKNDKAHLDLQKQIQEKTCKRYYLAVTYGKFREEEGEIENYLARGADKYEKFFVVPYSQGRYAKTLYKVISYFEGFSLVKFELKTGRTHQIRVHSNYLGHPIVGDKLYGRKNENFGLKGQLLHAYKLELVHPTTHKLMTFTSPLPMQFKEFLEKHNLGNVDENII